MSVTLTGSGGLFVKAGHVMGAAADAVALKGGSATARVLSGANMVTRGQTLESDYSAGSVNMTSVLSGTPDNPGISGGASIWSTISSWQSSQGALFSSLQRLLENTFTYQVTKDSPLSSLTITAALAELIRQMKANGDSINASTVAIGSVTAQGSPTGTPVFVLSKNRPDGTISQTLFAETLTIKATNDSLHTATARQEPFSITGGATAPDVWSHLWPAGSGANTSISLADAQLDNSGSTLLVNGDFEVTTTASNFDNWTLGVGAAGTNILSGGSGNAYTLSNSLEIVGDGSTLTSLTQTFNTATSTTVGAGGTPAKLAPQSQLALNCWIKVSATPAAGVLEFSLVDGSGTTVNDDAGNANLFTKSLTAVSTSWVNVNGVFRTPSVMPSTIKLKVRLSTALSAGTNLFLDDLALAKMTLLYNGGPYIAGFASNTNPVQGDTWTAATTNTMGVLAMWLERFFSLRDKGLQFPYSGSPTVADSLVA